MVITDFDGVVTDNCVYINEDFTMSRKLNFKDVMGFSILKKNGYDVAIISGEANPVITVLSEKFKITEIHQKIRIKIDVLKSIIEKYNLSEKAIQYMDEKVRKLEIKFAAMEATQRQLEKRIEEQNKTLTAAINQQARFHDKIKKLEYEVERLFKENIEKITPKPEKATPYKIQEITKDHIQFTNGDKITYNHEQDCCENNYADFEQIDDLAKQYEFQGELIFEKTENTGFRFGDKRCMFYVPCYSEQNGYYSNELNIYHNNKKVLSPDAEMIIY